MFVIGTAGHVDHGKSTLVQAMTGIDPDRLREEKERGMTIELGFAWLTLPGGLEVSVVDVPGHERFIKHMLMGVGGIDVALLVIAADEGVMPQTREHLAILDLLRIRRGVVALTKKDLVDDEWLELATAEAAECLKGTTLEGSPVVPVSAATGDGLEQLKLTLEKTLTDLPARADLGRPRLPVDRSFTMSGFGTVVTGTLQDGKLRIGQEVEVLPSGVVARVRGLQSHRRSVNEALPGTRVAVNVSGISYEQVSRGDLITVPGWLKGSPAFDASLRVIADAPRPIKHNARVTLYTGSAEVEAVIRLLNADRLEPGQTGWVQARLEQPVPVVRGDYYVVRDSVATLAGGNVVDPFARRHRRSDPRTLQRLASLAEGSEQELLLSALDAIQPATLTELATKANLSAERASELVAEAVGQSLVTAVGPGTDALYTAAGWQAVGSTASGALDAYHAAYPLRPGMPREELRSRLRMRAGPFLQTLARLADETTLVSDDVYVRKVGFSPSFAANQQAVVDAYLASLAESPFTPPTAGKIDPEILAALVTQGAVVRTGEDVVFLKSAYDEMAGRVADRIRDTGKVSVSDVRDMFGQSRKYVLALLEHMDRMQVTRRVGDDRVLR